MKNSKVPYKYEDEFYTSQEIAGELRVNIRTLYNHTKADKLAISKIGKKFRVDKKEFYSFLNKVKAK